MLPSSIALNKFITSAPCNIVILRQRHLLLRLLPMRAVINGGSIFQLKENEPAVIPCRDTETTLFITNGFQTSKKVKLKYQPGATYFFVVNALVDNTGMLTAAGITLLLFIAYILSGVKLLLLLANSPLLVLLYIFFINPQKSIVIKNWVPEKPVNH